jgi:hypothetical protein
MADAKAEPAHDETLVNVYLERISALSISAFDGADVGRELEQVVKEAVNQCAGSKAAPSGNNLKVLLARLQERADAAKREDQPQVQATFSKAREIAAASANRE